MPHDEDQLSRNSYSGGRRQREAEKARKKREKAERRRRNKENRDTGSIPIATVDELQPAAVETSNEEAIARSEERPETRRRPAARLFVGQLSWDTTTEGLAAYFAKIGDVVDAIVMTDRATGRSRGFGFVDMADPKEAKRAIDELNGSELDGREIRVSVATER